MVRTKNILFPLVKSLLVDHFERHADEDEHEFCPPPVELSYQPEFLSKNNGNEKQEEENHEKDKKNNKAI
jgi:hypothetical protein